MGYETKLIIGVPYTGDRRELMEIARVDICKVGYQTQTGRVLEEARKSEDGWSFYADDGDTRVTEDRYGDKITAVPLDDLVEAMEEDQRKEGTYRRFTLALALLKTFRDSGDWTAPFEEITVLQFGH